jgi:hypothetical protein
MKKIFVSQFDRINRTIPSMTVDLIEWLTTKQPSLMPILEEIRNGNLTKEEKKALKDKLPVITPSGIFAKRRIKSLITHSGIVCLDIDNIGDKLLEIKEQICKNPSVLFCCKSVSGNGLCAMVLIEDSSKHLEHYLALVEWCEEQSIKVDTSGSDVSRARFYTNDDDAYYNPSPIPFTGLLEGKEIPVKKAKSTPKRNIERKNETSNLEPKPELSIEEAMLQSCFVNGDILVIPKLFTKEELKILIDKVISFHIDITESYKDWFDIGVIIYQNFNEEGRGLFHEISSFYPNYTYEEADKQYSNCCGYLRKRDIFLQIAKKYGVELD